MRVLPYLVLVISLLFGATTSLRAQMRVAIAEFKNESAVFYLDEWQQSIPDLMQAQLSRSKEIIVLERRKLKAVLDEKALAMSGLTDSSKAQEIGSLLDAEYVITGTIHKVDNDYRIDASIVKVSTGETRSEKAVSPDRDHLQKMVELLGNNILFDLTGSGRYKNKIKLKGYPTTYFLVATVGLAVATGAVRAQYEKNLDAYHDNVQLDQFNTLYDKANNTQKLSVGLATLTGTALIGTVYCWIRNLSPKEIYAGTSIHKDILPYLTLNRKKEVLFGAHIYF
jgi:TolB-like protein